MNNMIKKVTKYCLILLTNPINNLKLVKYKTQISK